VSSTTDIASLAPGAARLRRTWERPDDAWASVLLVHGLGEHSGRYEHVGDQMAEAGLAVYAFDLPGFGRSSGRRAFVDRFDDYLDAVEEELEPLIESDLPVVLLGHSLGGLIAYRYSLSERPQPDALVLSAPALGANTPAWQQSLSPLLARVIPKVAIPNPIDGEHLSRDPRRELPRALRREAAYSPLDHLQAASQPGGDEAGGRKSKQHDYDRYDLGMLAQQLCVHARLRRWFRPSYPQRRRVRKHFGPRAAQPDQTLM